MSRFEISNSLPGDSGTPILSSSPPSAAWLTDNSKSTDDPAPCSAPVTGASPLLRADPPARTATGAEPPLAAAGHSGVTSGGRVGARLLPFRSRGRSGLRRLHAGH